MEWRPVIGSCSPSNCPTDPVHPARSRPAHVSRSSVQAGLNWSHIEASAVCCESATRYSP